MAKRKPLVIGAGNKVREVDLLADSVVVPDVDVYGRLVFRKLGDDAKSISLELSSGKLEVYEDPDGTPVLLGEVPSAGGGGGGGVASVVAGAFIDVDATDPANPQVSGKVSADPGNAIAAGGDGGLFVPQPTMPPPTVPPIIRDVTTADGAVTSSTYDTFRMPGAYTLGELRASVAEASTTGHIRIDVKKGGSTIFGTTPLVIEEGQTTSRHSIYQPDILGMDFPDDALVEIEIITEGAAAKGLRVYFMGGKQPPLTLLLDEPWYAPPGDQANLNLTELW